MLTTLRALPINSIIPPIAQWSACELEPHEYES